MRDVVGFVCVLALGVVPMIGCGSTDGTGGTGGAGAAGGAGGMAGSAGAGGIGGEGGSAGPSCGDGVVEGDEECDDTGESAACNDDCTFSECGDSVLNTTAGEACDDGNTVDGDGCSADCLSDESCGNRIIDPGEVCDQGENPTWCVAECTVIAKSCADILAGSASAPADGVYIVDPDAAGPLAETNVYCDMTTDGGGWTLTLKVQGGSDAQPWFNVALIGNGGDLPTTVDAPAVLSEGPTMADRSMYVTSMGSTEYRATLYDAADALVVDVASTYTRDDGRGLRCFAMGEPDCMTLDQACSPANTDARMISSNGASNFADGDTGHLCDIGWWDCDFCVDWSWISKTGSQGSPSGDNVVFTCDNSNLTTSDYTLFWVR